ncbi:MAG: hypothetical protein Q7J35_17285 [Candidatus Methanoperedens sp.]|nr:hypothetical protein [Candidatus Methanoperedens sp.]
MKRLISIVIILLIVAFSGCTDQKDSAQPEGQIFERANLNLNGEMMSIELTPTDARAGENITAKLVVSNTGSEIIKSETIEIQAKARSLNDFLANLALTMMSNEKKTMTFPAEFTEEIKPQMFKTLTRVFPTPRELKGRNLAGSYDITVILSVNGQKVESKTIELKLGSGTPREIYTRQEIELTPAITATPAPAVTATPTATPITTPTPVPTPEKVTVDSYIFSWTDVPGTDETRLKEYLKTKYSLDWIDNAKIEKTNGSKVITLNSDDKYVSLTMVENGIDINLTINDGRTDIFIWMFENSKQNVYSGKLITTKIMSKKFVEDDLQIDAGDWMQWRNYDKDMKYTIAERNGQIPNMTFVSREYYYFKTTGTYTFKLLYQNMRVEPPVQTIAVKLNTSQ